MNFVEGEVILDFKFKENETFIDTREFRYIISLKETYDFLLERRVINGAIIRIVKQYPLIVEVIREVLKDNHDLFMLEVDIARSIKNELQSDSIILFLDKKMTNEN